MNDPLTGDSKDKETKEHADAQPKIAQAGRPSPKVVLADEDLGKGSEQKEHEAKREGIEP